MACQKPEQDIVYHEIPITTTSGESNLLHTPAGDLILSWIESDSSGLNALRMSTWQDDKWTEGKTIAKGTDWFVNWADFPELNAFGDRAMAFHYLEKSSQETYSYDVKLRFSSDNGVSWTKAISAHDDNTQTEHGFVSKTALPDGTLMVAWLDGRQYEYAKTDSTFANQMTIRAAQFDEKGNKSKEYEIDNRVCDCCQTDMAITNQGPILVYRDRTEDERRDISVSRQINGQWESPRSLHEDGWIINGCPVNGPAIDAIEDQVVVSWFTAANSEPRIKAAWSGDNGANFNQPYIIDEASVLGRMDTKMISEKQAIVSWMRKTDDKSQIMLQRLSPDGPIGQPFTLAESSAERGSGFPRIAIYKEQLFCTWTETGEISRIVSCSVPLNKI